MIPKIIHQIWIGEKTPPTNHMDTWKNMNPEFEYIRWSEKEIIKRGLRIECQNRIDEMIEINGKADIIRWEILYKYGGVFLDADSICVEPIDDVLMNCNFFAGWEHEELRKGLIATGTMGFTPKHPLIKQAIDWIKVNCVNYHVTKQMAWQSVGPGLLTRLYNTGKYNDMTIFPSYTFLPIHCTKAEYKGHGKIYAYQEWGSTKQNYEQMNNMTLPYQFQRPPTDKSVSILISSLNTKAKYLKECLDSIKSQEGLFNMEIVWINDGSDIIHTSILKKILNQFEKTTRFTTIIYDENDGNKGLGYSLNKGVNLCSNEIIIRMDADDIMYPNRIQKQLEYMELYSDCVLSGSQINMFKEINNTKINYGVSQHKEILDVNLFLKNKTQHWIMNHPTFCFRKKSIIDIGSYNSDIHSMYEDFELILRVLKKYGKIYNIQEPLLYYRLHEEQLTYNGGSNKYHEIRMELINKLFTH
jgi:GT2 family glycosyltransferase